MLLSLNTLVQLLFHNSATKWAFEMIATPVLTYVQFWICYFAVLNSINFCLNQSDDLNELLLYSIIKQRNEFVKLLMDYGADVQEVGFNICVSSSIDRSVI